MVCFHTPLRNHEIYSIYPLLHECLNICPKAKSTSFTLFPPSDKIENYDQNYFSETSGGIVIMMFVNNNVCHLARESI